MSTYSTNLKIELIGTGEQVGTWGNTTNLNFSDVFETAIVGRVTINFATDANKTLSAADSVAAQDFRNVYLNLTSGVSLTTTRELIVPTINKNYVIQNNTTGGQSITVKTSAGTGITVPNGTTVPVYVDGTNVIQAFDYIPSLNIGTLDLTNIEVTNIKAKDGTASASIANSTGVMTINSSVLTTTDINGGTIDGTAIGSSSASTGAFTTLSASGAASFNGGVTLGDASGDALTINSSAVSIPNGLAFSGGNISVANGNGYGWGDFTTRITGSSATDTIIFATDASERMRIDSVGNVGIGTNSPNALLHVSNASATIRIGLTTSSQYTDIYRDNSTGYTVYNAAQAATFRGHIWQLGGSEAMRIDTSGNVGIGTSSPSFRLDVSGNARFTSDVTGGTGRTISGGTGGYVLASNGINTDFISNGRAASITAGWGTVRIHQVASHAGLRIIGDTSQTADYMNVESSAGSILYTINSSGNVGIGTSSPQSRLEVRQDQAGAITRVIANNNFATNGSGSSFDYYFGTTRLGGLTHAFSTSAYLAFDVWSGSAATERMRLDSSGNLGLGVTPSAWGSGWKAVQLPNGVSVQSHPTLPLAYLNANSYFDGSVNRYVVNGYASRFVPDGNSGGFVWQTAPSGTAGNTVTYTSAMTLDASGRLLVGTTSASGYRTQIVGTSSGALQVNGNGGASIYIDDNSTGNNYFDTGSSGNNIFRTSSTERMRIDSSGNLLVGKTAADTSNAGVWAYNAGGGVGRINLVKTATGTNSAIANYHAGTYVGGVDYSNTATSFPTSSDIRLKKDIVDAESASEKIDQIRIVSHGWKHDDEVVEFGVVAQELYEIAPQAVTKGDDGEEIEKTWGVDYSKLVPMLLKAHQEQQAIINDLKARIEQLETK